MKKEIAKADLPRLDVRLSADLREELKKRAAAEHRSGNLQAVHYIETGIKGIDLETLARKIDNIELMLTEALRRLNEK